MTKEFSLTVNNGDKMTITLSLYKFQFPLSLFFWIVTEVSDMRQVRRGTGGRNLVHQKRVLYFRFLLVDITQQT